MFCSSRTTGHRCSVEHSRPDQRREDANHHAIVGSGRAAATATARRLTLPVEPRPPPAPGRGADPLARPCAHASAYHGW
jgi:hypothetical protein